MATSHFKLLKVLVYKTKTKQTASFDKENFNVVKIDYFLIDNYIKSETIRKVEVEKTIY